jgi:hypothetical protein
MESGYFFTGMMFAQFILLDSLAFGSEENEAEKEKKSAFDEAS